MTFFSEQNLQPARSKTAAPVSFHRERKPQPPPGASASAAAGQALAGLPHRLNEALLQSGQAGASDLTPLGTNKRFLVFNKKHQNEKQILGFYMLVKFVGVYPSRDPALRA